MGQSEKRTFNNLLVTGGCGFIGTNFIRYLLKESDFSGKIINVDRLTYAGNPLYLKDIEQDYPEQYTFIFADICDSAQMEKLFIDHQIDAICHFAAESHVDRSIESPGTFIQTNIFGTYVLIEIARKYMKFDKQLKLFHHVSTDEVFGSLAETGFFSEKSPYQPNSPYSASKAASDHMVRAYGATYDLPYTLSNCSNNYGPFQFPEKLIPKMTLNALDNKTLPVYGAGKNVRDWLYVDDHCRAIWTIMTQGKLKETYTIGGNAEIENIEMVRHICSILDRIVPSNIDRQSLIEHVKDRPGHDLRYAIDCSKIKEELGWQPLESFQSGLEKTIQWYVDHKDWLKQFRV